MSEIFGEEFQKDVGQINAFSSVLASLLNSLKITFNRANAINELKTNQNRSDSEVSSLKENIGDLDASVMTLKQLSYQRPEEALALQSSVEKRIVTQVSTVTGDLHNELLGLRTTIKSELTAIQGAFSQIMMESLSNLMTSNVPPLEFASDALPEDILRGLVERIGALEKRIGAQQAVNLTLTQAVKSEYQVHDHFDASTAQMTLLEQQLAALRDRQDDLDVAMQDVIAGDGQPNTNSQSSNRSNSNNNNRSSRNKQRQQKGSTKRVKEDFSSSQGSLANILVDAPEELAAQRRPSDDPFRISPVRPETFAARQPDIFSGRQPSESFSRHMSISSRDDPSTFGGLVGGGGPGYTDELERVIAELGDRLGMLEAQVHSGMVKEKMEQLEREHVTVQSRLTETAEGIKRIQNDLDIINKLDRDILKLERERKTNMTEVLADLKGMWRRVLADINVGLDNLHVNYSEGSKADQLVPSLGLFRLQLMSSLPAFEPLENAEVTLDALYPRLDALTSEADRLLDLDKDARLPESLGVTFDDLICADRSYNLGERLAAVCEKSSQVLDQRVQKVQLKRRIERMEKAMGFKVDKGDLMDVERDLRALIAAKADVRDVEGILGKKASVAELQQFRELVFNQIEDIKMAGFSGPPGSTRRTNGEGGSTYNEDDSKLSADREELTKRFELLYRQFQDLMAHCSVYVPRDEVEAALHTVLSEVKAIKTSYVDATSLREKLKKKADSTDLDRLLTLLSANLTESERTSSAMHAKCLVCDKPVIGVSNVLTSKSASALPGVDSPGFPSTPAIQMGYDKAKARAAEQERSGKEGGGGETPKPVPGTGTGRSSAPGPGKKPPVNVTAEFSVMKNSIDLPPIGEGVYSSGQANYPQPGAAAKNFKSRIRSSAGGGVGPSYTLDTR